MLKCRNQRNQRKLTLAFVYAELVDPYYSLVPKSIYQLRREYRSRQHVEYVPAWRAANTRAQRPMGRPGAVHALLALATWLRKEFAVRANLHAQLAGPGASRRRFSRC
jgi:hypothetical protein